MIKYIQPPPVSAANGMLHEMYGQIRNDFGFVGDIFTIHSLSPSLLAGLWSSMRETEMVGKVPRSIKEAVAVAVAKSNQCPFCVDAHSMMLMATGNNQVVQRINSDQAELIPDEKMRSVVQWALATRSPGSSLLLNPPFTNLEAPEIIGTAVTNHYITRMIDVLLSNQSPIPVRNAFLKKLLQRAVALVFASSVRKSRNQGASLVFTTESELPNDFWWAEHHPYIRFALAAFADAVNRAGEQSLTEDSRTVVKQHIDAWTGEEPGISRQWAEKAVSSLSGGSRTAARLALLTAIAPYQIDDELIHEFQSVHREGIHLLNVLSWSSFMAARRIGTWLSAPFKADEEGNP
ncbi:carboxymuconolactone decarboxylase family protein [Cohnella sp. REN36]|uniref:carboxymuconolactone decarboxylase family protein n=1 Tax=Cohnella sp. REN36 TaxID=2887347 RepID=UPI001D1422C2|nr:carboxymuconolactone decarboxylase family protein [Cohnella sp. REN36]MCC3373601.1 carboxymuconolactone decarboxylase family protein [Cohnella sp. REN36]